MPRGRPVPAVGLFIVWEIGKLVARHYADGSEPGPDVIRYGALA